MTEVGRLALPTFSALSPSLNQKIYYRIPPTQDPYQIPTHKKLFPCGHHQIMLMLPVVGKKIDTLRILGVGKLSDEDKQFMLDEIGRRQVIDYKISVDRYSEDEYNEECDDDVL